MPQLFKYSGAVHSSGEVRHSLPATEAALGGGTAQRRRRKHHETTAPERNQSDRSPIRHFVRRLQFYSLFNPEETQYESLTA